MTGTPSFVGQRAVILHRPGEVVLRLARRLSLLGVATDARWRPLEAGESADLVIVDADEGWDRLLPWAPGEKATPLIALLGSEAPGRIAWALDQGADAMIVKPVNDAAIYPALVMAARRCAEARAVAERIARLEERVRLRSLVHAAVRSYMEAERCDETTAYDRLRRDAMRRRLTLEQTAAARLADPHRQAG